MLTKKQLAIELNLSVPTIDRLMKEGMPYYKIMKSVRFDIDAVKDWLRGNK